MRRQNSEQSKQRLSATMLTLRTANKKRPCAICLRKVGFGMTRTCRALQVGKATVSRWYRQSGIAINSERNGVALHGHGLRARLAQAMILVEKRRAIRLKHLAQAMERVSRREHRIPCPTRGMTEAQAFKWRYHNSPEDRIYELCRRRMKRVLHGIKKAGKSMELVGCTTAHLRAHIESQFKKGMNWTNAGTGKGKWHIDHCIPCAPAFDSTREDQQRICFHWTNLRPMWSLDNISKGARLEART